MIDICLYDYVLALSKEDFKSEHKSYENQLTNWFLGLAESLRLHKLLTVLCAHAITKEISWINGQF